jgi:iron complex transport system permease protein
MKRFLITLCILFGLSLVSLLSGNKWLTMSELWSVMNGSSQDNALYFMVWEYRLPKTLMAMSAGAGLALSGLLMQTLFRNPLAGPYVLGISSGASFGVGLLVLGAGFLPVGLQQFMRADGMLIIAALIGALFVLLAMVWAASRVAGGFTILIMGLILGQIMGALQGALTFLASPESLKQFSFWGLGSFNQTSLQQNILVLLIVVVCVCVALFMVAELNNYLIGDQYARSQGVNIKKFRVIVILIAGVCAAVITAFAGPIAFVGMAVPHLTRHFFKTYNHFILIPMVVLVGACLTLVCDIFSHWYAWGFVVPVNILAALIGGPIVIWVVFKHRNLSSNG